jgi:hypothetical protein
MTTVGQNRYELLGVGHERITGASQDNLNLDMAGYSGTHLTKKLGIKEGARIVLANAPKGFLRELGELPPQVHFVTRAGKPIDIVLLFAKSESGLKKEFVKMAKSLSPSGMLWVAWPKKSSGVPTDLSFNNVQRVGLEAGLVDVKICAVNDVWSGLKFVYRLRDRPRRGLA